MNLGRLRRIAYHEAGHAVAAWSLGQRFRKVTVVETEDYLGAVLYKRWRKFHPDNDLTPTTRDRVEKAIVTSLAGLEAERLIAGRYNRSGARYNLANAADLGPYLVCSDEELAVYMKLLSIRTKNLLRSSWAQIVAVSAALLVRGQLCFDEVSEISLRSIGVDPDLLNEFLTSPRERQQIVTSVS